MQQKPKEKKTTSKSEDTSQVDKISFAPQECLEKIHFFLDDKSLLNFAHTSNGNYASTYWEFEQRTKKLMDWKTISRNICQPGPFYFFNLKNFEKTAAKQLMQIIETFNPDNTTLMYINRNINILMTRILEITSRNPGSFFSIMQYLHSYLVTAFKGNYEFLKGINLLSINIFLGNVPCIVYLEKQGYAICPLDHANNTPLFRLFKNIATLSDESCFSTAKFLLNNYVLRLKGTNADGLSLLTQLMCPDIFPLNIDIFNSNREKNIKTIISLVISQLDATYLDKVERANIEQVTDVVDDVNILNFMLDEITKKCDLERGNKSSLLAPKQIYNNQ